jgi:hypothetical protein
VLAGIASMGWSYIYFSLAPAKLWILSGVYQDIQWSTESSLGNNASAVVSFLFGVNARTSEGTGVLKVILQALNNQLDVVWEQSFNSTVSADNGDGRAGEADSLYLSSKFIYNTGRLAENTKINSIRKLKFMVLPLDLQTYYIVDAFVNRFPSV